MTKCSPGNRQTREPRKPEVAQMSAYYIPIDVEFNADSKNVYFDINILNI